MAFPVTGLLDDFTGSNGSINGRSLSSGQGTWVVTDNDLQIVSNAINSSGSNFGGARTSQSFGPDCEVFITLTDPPDTVSGCYCQIGARRQANGDSYGLFLDGSGAFQIRVYPFSILDSATRTWTAGDKVGFELIGDALKGYHYTSGAWNEVLSVTDSTITAAGYLTVSLDLSTGTSIILDDFSGGSIGQTLLPDADIAAGLWINELGAASPLYSKVADYSDTTYMRGTAA